MTAGMLTEGRPPGGFWAQRLDWTIDSVDGSVRARTEARDAVASGEAHGSHQPHPSGHVFATASERVAMTMGELTVNGLRHGEPPITASLARGTRGWLLVVSDTAPDRVPIDFSQQAVPDGTAVGGLGLRLVMSMAAEVGWWSESGRKQVWALIGDTPPAGLITRLNQAISS